METSSPVFISGFSVATALLLLQEMLSLFSHNQILPLIVGLARLFFRTVLPVFPGKYHASCSMGIFCSLLHNGIKLEQNYKNFHLL